MARLWEDQNRHGMKTILLSVAFPEPGRRAGRDEVIGDCRRRRDVSKRAAADEINSYKSQLQAISFKYVMPTGGEKAPEHATEREQAPEHATEGEKAPEHTAEGQKAPEHTTEGENAPEGATE